LQTGKKVDHQLPKQGEGLMMRTVLCISLILALVGIANADVYSDNAKAAQEVADAFFKTIADNDFDAYKGKVAAKLLDEYNRNNANCKIKRWWDSARKEIEKFNARWEFVKVKSNMPKSIALDYKRIMSSGETINTVYLTKEGDKWLVDAAGSI
jgi:hypothetical protein